MQVSAVLIPAEEGGYVVFNPETGTTTQGETVEEALAAIKEAVELYLEHSTIPFAGAPIVTTVTVVTDA